MNKFKAIAVTLLLILAALVNVYIVNRTPVMFHGINTTYYNAAMCLIVDILVLFIILKWEVLATIPREIWQNRRVAKSLAVSDFKTNFSGSYLGVVWAFVQPIVTAVLFWFVFEFALGAGPQGMKGDTPIPFVVWLTGGLIPWFYFADAFNAGTNTFHNYSYLVKKVVFNISILPFVKVVSNLFVHFAFVLFGIFMFSCLGILPSVMTLQVVYYTFCLVCYASALSYITSTICVFFKDISQLVAIFMQVFMWATPIMWNIDSIAMNPVIKLILTLNPMYYIVQGYRDSLINGVSVINHFDLSIYFWFVTVILFYIGTTLYKNLKMHFADVL